MITYALSICISSTVWLSVLLNSDRFVLSAKCLITAHGSRRLWPKREADKWLKLVCHYKLLGGGLGMLWPHSGGSPVWQWLDVVDLVMETQISISRFGLALPKVPLGKPHHFELELCICSVDQAGCGGQYSTMQFQVPYLRFFYSFLNQVHNKIHRHR